MNSSFFDKVVKVVTSRPWAVFGYARSYLLFANAFFWRNLLPTAGVTLGKNVRLQRNKSLSAERPNSTVTIGDNTVVYEDANIDALGDGAIRIGKNSIVGATRISSRYNVTIGDRFLSSWNTYIQDFDPHPIDPALRGSQVENMVLNFQPTFGDCDLKPDNSIKDWDFPGEAITLGNDVWLGANATILKGVTIGDGCIVAAGAVVTRGNYPPFSIIAGNPAKVVKSVESSEPYKSLVFA